jgi:hypothetical protein
MDDSLSLLQLDGGDPVGSVPNYNWVGYCLADCLGLSLADSSNPL